jgi:hypothetical protein
VIGDASAKFTVRPSSTDVGYLASTFNPASTAPAHSPITLTLSINNPPEFHWFRFRYLCGDLCSTPGSGVSTNQSSSATFPMTLGNPGSYAFSIGADKIRQSDCAWVASIEWTHANPYSYTVTP